MVEFDSRTDIQNQPPMLRPLGFGELLDTTLNLYRTHFLRFLGIASSYFITIVVGSAISIFKGSISQAVGQAIWIPTIIAAFGITVMVIGQLISATSQAYLERTVSTRDLIKSGIRRFFACIFGALLYGSLAIITTFLTGASLSVFFTAIPLFALLVFPMFVFIGVYFVTDWFFFTAAILIEGKSMRNAVKRGRELIRGRTFQIGGRMIGVLLLYVGISFIFRASLGLLLTFTGFTNITDLMQEFNSLMFIRLPIIQGELSLSNIVLHLIYLSIDTITMPIWIIGATLLYFEQRIRKEGFDIEIMATR